MSTLYLFNGILAVCANAFVRAQDAHLKALTIFLLTLTLLASAASYVRRIDVGLACAFDLRRARLRLGAQRSSIVLSLILNFRFESEWITASNILARTSYFFLVALLIATVLACTSLVTVAPNREAFAVHLEAARLRAFTSDFAR